MLSSFWVKKVNSRKVGLFYRVLKFFDTRKFIFNVKTIEKILQLGYNESLHEQLPMFAPFYEAENPPFNKSKFEINSELPYLSITHDILKDRNVILYDQGNDLHISYEEDE